MIEPCWAGVENYNPGLRNLLSSLEKDTLISDNKYQGKMEEQQYRWQDQAITEAIKIILILEFPHQILIFC